MNISSGLVRVQLQNSHLVSSQVKPSQDTEEGLKNASVEAGGESDTRNGDKVSLSREGMNKQVAEADGADKKSGGSIMDQVIEKLKERIESVNEQLAALAGKEGPEVEAQRKALQDELGILQGALLSAIEEKNRIEGEALA